MTPEDYHLMQSNPERLLRRAKAVKRLMSKQAYADRDELWLLERLMVMQAYYHIATATTDHWWAKASWKVSEAFDCKYKLPQAFGTAQEESMYKVGWLIGECSLFIRSLSAEADSSMDYLLAKVIGKSKCLLLRSHVGRFYKDIGFRGKLALDRGKADFEITFTDSKGRFQPARDTQKRYFLLMLWADKIENMKSRTEIHEFLSEQLGSLAGTADNTRELCKAIGLSLKGRGAPKLEDCP